MNLPANRSNNAPAVPDWLAEVDDNPMGLDEVSQYVRQPFLGIVQKQSGSERQDKYGIGTSVIFPQGIEVCGKDEAMIINPLLMWPSWEKRSDINDTQQPMVVESTLDKTSDIAMRSKTKALREEPYGDDWKYTYVENLNFIVRICNGPAAGEMATLVFNRAEHWVGQSLCDTIARRRRSIYTQRFELTKSVRQRPSNASQEWYGYDINNPSEEDGGPWISAEEYEDAKRVHMELDEARKANMIVIVGSDQDEDPVGGNQGDGAEQPEVPF